MIMKKIYINIRLIYTIYVNDIIIDNLYKLNTFIIKSFIIDLTIYKLGLMKISCDKLRKLICQEAQLQIIIVN